MPGTNKIPVVLLGGRANSISAIRSFRRLGVPIFVICREGSPPLYSRYIARGIEFPRSRKASSFFNETLLENPQVPAGSVIFACCDESIEFVATHKALLTQHYLLDIHDSVQQLDLLDKQKTLAIARAANCPIPGYSKVENLEDLKLAAETIQYPVIIKPIHSHEFQARFNSRKLFLIQNERELFEKAHLVLEADISFFLSDCIPGPDTLLTSYYVYIAEDGEVLFEFTKRVIRRAPPNFGIGSLHLAQWDPETARMGYQFFSGMGFKGLGNIEFKRDPRDNQLKVIESNARLTGAQELVTRSGIDMPLIIYNYLCFGVKPGQQHRREGLTLWLPFEDADSFRDLRSAGQITFLSWLNSIARFHVFSYFNLADPKPFIYDTIRQVKQRIKWKLQKT